MSSLHAQHLVLGVLATGPKTKPDIKRVMGWPVLGTNRHVDALLRNLSDAGLVRPGPVRGEWQLGAGIHVCATCLGRGISKSAPPAE